MVGPMNPVAARLLPVLACVALLAASATAVRPAVAGTHHAGHQAGRALALAHLIPRVPEPGSGSALNGVYCVRRASCWAVGDYDPSKTVSLNEVLHWNGSAWVRVPVPNPAGTANGDTSMLSAVRCARSRDCWAVGLYQKGKGAGLAQALHWTGRKWFKVATPATPAGTASGAFSQLFDVACPSIRDCWAVGGYGTETGNIWGRNEALHWNGRKWSLVSTPNPAGTAVGDLNGLASIRCTSADYCLAVGDYGTLSPNGVTNDLLNEALRWNGRRWSTLSAPNPGGTGTDDINSLNGLACSSSRNCWAVGTYGNFSPGGGLLNEAMHWNGQAWSQVAVPEPATNAEDILAFAACGSATDCWAVGMYFVAGATEVGFNEAMHWDGAIWSLVDTPDPAGVGDGDSNQLSALRCASPSNCWAVGSDRTAGNQSLGQILHWGGARWTVR